MRSVVESLPLAFLSLAYLWLFQARVSDLSPDQLVGACASPPLPTLGLLALAGMELTRGSRVRGTFALFVVAIPSVLSIVSEVIN
jgi:hypothetical protein